MTELEDDMIDLMRWFGLSIEETATIMAFSEGRVKLQIYLLNWMVDMRDSGGEVTYQKLMNLLGGISPNSPTEEQQTMDS
ncbi:MAG: hypothetical protein IKF68_00650 [Erysipelotrichaceae bacterium]|nr:hypothetical protein [Erysipelotrichaceae bacterium]